MIISSKVRELLEENKIRANDGLVYLLALHFNLPTPDYIPSTLRTRVHALGIVEYYRGELIWNLPLFSSNITDPEIEKLSLDYLACFKPYDKDTMYAKEVPVRLRSFISQHPDVTRQEIISATEMYIQECLFTKTEVRYVRHPHYFIEKGRGKSKIQPLLTWIEKYREQGIDDKEDETIVMQ